MQSPVIITLLLLSTCKTKLLEARRQAVKRKYLLYATDARFRRAYQNRIYFNANKDVPVGLHLPVPNKTQIIELVR